MAMLLIEAALVASLGLWMVVAVYDNWRHAKLNRDAVAMVMRFDMMERDYPDEFRLVSHRKVENETLISLCFNAIRLAESTAAVILVAAALGLMLAGFGQIDAGGATTFALIATTFFILIWAGFIVGGNYFHYYFCHQWGQSNHFMFMYWGFFVLLVLMI